MTISGKRKSSGLRTKLVRVYALQVGLISIAAVIGVYITYVIVEDVLTRQALNQESTYFWDLHERDPAHPLPNTGNMRGYLMQGADDTSIPEPLRGLPDGFGRAEAMPESPLVHISSREDNRLFLVFAEARVSSLVFYFGLAPLLAVLLTVYALLFLTYRLSHQAISPMINLARALESFDFRSNSRLLIPAHEDGVDRETGLMIESLRAFSDRLELFVERERTFTRNASHELRTPIAVLKGSLDLLESRERDASEQRVLARIRKVTTDMETILETLLLLAREEDVAGDVVISVNQVIIGQIELLSEMAEQQQTRIKLVEEVELTTRANERVAGIIFSNLLRNAITYTQAGTITISVFDDGFSVTDTGIGISEEDQERVFTAFYRAESSKEKFAGQGLGLALVKRLCDQLGWLVQLESVQGQGTTVRVTCSPRPDQRS